MFTMLYEQAAKKIPLQAQVFECLRVLLLLKKLKTSHD